MIDIGQTPDCCSQHSGSRASVVLFAALVFVVWDSNYIEKWLPSGERSDSVLQATAALLIKSQDMTADQKYTANSPVLDEIADQRGIKFRVISDKPGKLSESPEWIQKLFLECESQSPCLAVVGDAGKVKTFPPPSSVSEFRKRIGAK